MLLRGGKKGTSKRTTVLFALLFVYAFGYVGFMNYELFKPLCLPFHELGFDWLFFAYAAIFALVFTIFGCIFTIQSQVFESKDNDMLLAMPIPPMCIFISRLIPIFAQTLLLSTTALLPAFIIYTMQIEVSVTLLLCFLLMFFAVPLLSIVICTALGTFTAWVSSKIAYKNLVTILISLLFIVGYVYLSTNSQSLLDTLINDGEGISNAIKAYFWIFYQAGLA